MDVKASLDSAQALYNSGKYSEAVLRYKELENVYPMDGDIAYNLGNCFTRLGQFGEARLHFERSLLLDPNNADATHNLDYIVQMKLSDAVIEPADSLFQWLGSIIRSLAVSEIWLQLLMITLLISIILLVVRRWIKPNLSWRWPFTSTLTSIILASIFWISVPNSDKVIVTSNSSYGYSEPSKNSKRILLLSEGSAARLYKSSEGWFFLELGDGRLAWFEAAQWGRVLPPESTIP